MVLVPFALGYAVSSLGELWSCRCRKRKGERIKSEWHRVSTRKPKKARYINVNLCVDGIRQQWLLHRLILTVFRGSPPSGHQSCHRNSNRFDNRLENLRWDTPAGNAIDKKAAGTWPAGTINGRAKLSDDDVRAIRWLRELGYKVVPISRWYRISPTLVSFVALHRFWKHVT